MAMTRCEGCGRKCGEHETTCADCRELQRLVRTCPDLVARALVATSEFVAIRVVPRNGFTPPAT